MGTFNNLTDIARLAINRMVAVTEKEKKLLHKALDAQADAVTGLENVVEDLTPQLGGDLDFNSQKATGFTSTGIDDNATVEALQISDTSAIFGNSGGTFSIYSSTGADQLLRFQATKNNGGQMHLYGSTHSTDSNDIKFLGGTVDALHYDDSASSWNFQANQIILDNTLTLKERAASLADVAAYGQVWVKNTTPNELWFTDDAGTDFQLGVGGAFSAVVDDLTPQLGGHLDVNGKNIVSAGAGDINITPDTTGNVVLDGITWPNADGSANQVLETDGAGVLTWVAKVGSGIANVVDDVTPQLGGPLDVNAKAIVSAAGGDIAITPDTTGDIILDGQKWPQADGTNTYVLQTDGAGQLSWVEPASGAVTSISATLPLTKTGTTSVTLDINNASAGVDGAMSGADKTRLDGIESNADVTDAINVAAAGALMQWNKNMTVEDPTSGDDLSWFFTNEAITITELRMVGLGSTVSSVVTIKHGTDRSAAGTTVYTGTLTGTATGNDITSFSDATIPADSFVWLEIGTTHADTTQIHMTAIGTID